MFTKKAASKKTDNTKAAAKKSSKPKKAKKAVKPKKPKKPLEYIILDIGSRTTKIITGKIDDEIIYINNIIGIINEKKVSHDGKIINIDAVSQSIRLILEAKKIKTKNVILTLESTTCIRREVNIVSVPDEDVAGLVTYEMGQYLPIDVNSYVIQVKSTEEYQENGVLRKKVAVGAVPKVLSQNYAEVCFATELLPSYLDMNSNAIEKLVTLEMINNPRCIFSGKRIVFIDMGHSIFNICIFDNGKYTFSKVLETGGAAIDEFISKRLKISLSEAELLKINNATNYAVKDLEEHFESKKPELVEEIILYDTLQVYKDWAIQIGEILKYYTSRDRNNVIDEIYLYGGCSYINGIEEFLSSNINIPVKTFYDFQSIEIVDQTKNKGLLNYLNVIGALIRE